MQSRQWIEHGESVPKKANIIQLTRKTMT